ncbi:thiamine pyrophosphate-dependent enzyme [Kocuria rhizophila]|nr:thiamine pyrophosphate-dependent enzyme [Kocuria rhizophila]
MGYSVPGAVSVSLEQPERFVFAVAGDGEFLTVSQELRHRPAVGAHPLIIVLERPVGTIRAHQENHYPAAFLYRSWRTPTSPPWPAATGPSARLERNEDIEGVVATPRGPSPGPDPGRGARGRGTPRAAARHEPAPATATTAPLGSGAASS